MKKKSELMKMVAIISFTSLVTNAVACGSSLSLSETSNEESSGTEGEDSSQDDNGGAAGQQKNNSKNKNSDSDSKDEVSIEEITEKFIDEVASEADSDKEEVRYYLVDDFDDDGAYEGFMFVGGEEDPDWGSCDGTVWFVNESGCEKIHDEFSFLVGENENIFSILQEEDRNFVVFRDLYATADVSNIYYVDGEKCIESRVSYLGSSYVGKEKGDLNITVSEYDMYCDFEGDAEEGTWTGHTWKPYYFYYSSETGDFEEYGAVEISEDELSKLIENDPIIEIKEEGYAIDQIIKRDNGVININYHMETEGSGRNYEYKNATYDLNTGLYVNVWGDGEAGVFDSDYGGIYYLQLLDSDDKDSESASSGDAHTYEEKIYELRSSEPVTPDNEDILKEMAECVTFSCILDYEGITFADMDNSDKASLRYHIVDYVTWDQKGIYEDVCETVNDKTAIPLDTALDIFKDFYGEENFTPGEHEDVDDEYYYPLYADGEPWELVEHMQFFEDDDYILYTGPGFYESNGGDEAFVGYADILFAKNKDSRFGVTVVFGWYREDTIDVSSVEASSTLSSQGGNDYNAENLIDGDYTTIWAEGVKGTGVGETITIHLEKDQLVYGVLICNGYTASYEQYNNNGRLTQVSVDFGGGNVVKGDVDGYGYEGFSSDNLADSNRTKIELDEPVMTDTIVITITGAEKGAKYDDTCVSELLVY